MSSPATMDESARISIPTGAQPLPEPRKPAFEPEPVAPDRGRLS